MTDAERAMAAALADFQQFEAEAFGQLACAKIPRDVVRELFLRGYRDGVKTGAMMTQAIVTDMITGMTKP